MENPVICPICLSILYRPTTLPCNHVFCKDCILSAVGETSYQCPMCRFRLSNWLRKIKDLNCAVDTHRENELRAQFPNYYQARESGVSPTLRKSEQLCLDEINEAKRCDAVLARPGELHSEYLNELAKFTRLKAVEETKNEEASLALAFQLLAEDGLTSAPDDLVTDTIHSLLHTTNCATGETVSCSTVKNHSPGDRNALKNSRCKKTILDYAVYERCQYNPQSETSVTGTSEIQVSQDEEFARKLQNKYWQLSSTPPIINTRSKR
ncbi:Ring finger protein [Paragonimus heterotremus]|uniref:RING-type E3 ubiquitin transferase n=1 Tax=Paragonimus heterotremus TaxID=100268 RepID=A0A8J4WEX3_9TREM|nr:Ring finger protein [Paragonimus heterotremus]